MRIGLKVGSRLPRELLRQIAIVYFLYVQEVNAACSAISHLGVKAAVFTGECSSLDTNHIHAAMKNWKIQILCTTAVCGCGLDLLDIPCVVCFSLPKNFSSWMPEQGRAGHDQHSLPDIYSLNVDDI